ncbi:unnamed protein product [Clavelina lepadiformis]|uniref:Uncharacterized protein n=1 Tax=Clavelina lepadiformis TaxID=159417 RepID=A0ABP0EUJ2_CLALP
MRNTAARLTTSLFKGLVGKATERGLFYKSCLCQRAPFVQTYHARDLISQYFSDQARYLWKAFKDSTNFALRTCSWCNFVCDDVITSKQHPTYLFARFFEMSQLLNLGFITMVQAASVEARALPFDIDVAPAQQHRERNNEVNKGTNSSTIVAIVRSVAMTTPTRDRTRR